MLRAGIVGLPNVGKSTLFNALTSQQSALAANYPFATIEPNIGVVAVPDERLEPLAKLVKTSTIIPATVEFVDIAGLVRGASKGEGLGNQFLANIRETDTVVQVVRCFEDDSVVHVEGSINPQRDIETIQIELVLADLATVERRRERAQKTAKGGDKTARAELEVLDKIQPALEEGKPARVVSLTTDEHAVARGFFLLTLKPTIYAANVDEATLSENVEENAHVRAVREIATSESAEFIIICAQLEAEVVELPLDERKDYLEALGVKGSGVDRLIKSAYRLLGLMSFLTAGEKEVRAWTIPQGTRAPQAAGVIHSDIERGFIRAETVSYDQLIRAGSYAVAREQGLLRLEGKEYVMQEGDVVHFRFNV
ncbi:MAG: ribosome-binding ATPase [Acidobacteriota bacterium]|jgi:GTP-binding protein YchF|nr:ribosome-binding ATPase [Acidobacteriota bacterium]